MNENILMVSVNDHPVVLVFHVIARLRSNHYYKRVQKGNIYYCERNVICFVCHESVSMASESVLRINMNLKQTQVLLNETRDKLSRMRRLY